MSVITGVVGPPDPDSPLVSLFSSKSFPPGLNTSHYDKVDDLLLKAATTVDPAARKAAYLELLRRVALDAPVIPLYQDRLFLAHTEMVQGLVQNSMFTMQSYSVSMKG